VAERARHPGGTLPQKLPRPEEVQAFYRLCDADDVTHTHAVVAPHRQRTWQFLQTCGHFVPAVHDATELDDSAHASLRDDLGQIGNGHQRGSPAQNTLVVDPQHGVVAGLAHQLLHVRPRVAKGETPAGEAALAGRLLTNPPVDTAAAALLVKTGHECRWTVAELHQAMQTGCGIESLCFPHVDRLKPAIGILSSLAPALRDAGRHPQAKDRPAREPIDEESIEVLSLRRHRSSRPDWTQSEFCIWSGLLGRPLRPPEQPAARLAGALARLGKAPTPD